MCSAESEKPLQRRAQLSWPGKDEEEFAWQTRGGRAGNTTAFTKAQRHPASPVV